MASTMNQGQGFGQAAFNMNDFQNPRQAMSQQMTQQQSKKPWWTALLSEGGGAGGAAAGAAIGTALLPGIGTIAGGALGAFLGGTGGRLAENKIRDNKFNVGSALGEGATDAALSGVSALNSVRKGAKAAKALSSVTKGVDNPQALLQAPEKVGLIQGVGKSLRAGASGYGIGAGSAANQLDANASDAIGNTLKTLKIPATAPETQARMLGNHIDNMGNLLSAQYAKANVPIAQTEINHLGASILGQVANTGGLSKGAEAFALEQAQKLAKAKDVNEVWKFTKDLARNATNFGANPDSKLVDKEAAARIILDQTRGFLNGKVPGVAATNDLYHQAKTAEKFILDASKDKGGGLIQRLASSAPAKAAEAKTGALLENTGKFTAGTGAPVTQLTHQGIVQAPGNLLHGFSDMQQSAQTPQQGTPQDLLGGGQQPQDATASLLGQGQDATASLLGQPQQPDAQSGPSLQSLQQAIQQDIGATGGKNINNLMQLGQLYGIVDQQGSPVQQGGSGPSNLGKISAQQYGLAQSGRQSLQQLAQLIQSDPNIIEKNATPGQGVPLIGSLVSNSAGASNYHSLADNILSSLIHLQTGATATKEEITSAHGQLPQPGDSPETQQRKIQTLLGNFAPFLGSN